MVLGEKLKRLRQEKGLSQAQLAKRLQIHQKQVSGYERGVHVPKTDLLIRMAEFFQVSLDFLAFEDRDETRRVTIGDLGLIERLEAIDKLSDADKETVKAVLDTFILKSRFQRLAEGAGD